MPKTRQICSKGAYATKAQLHVYIHIYVHVYSVWYIHSYRYTHTLWQLETLLNWRKQPHRWHSHDGEIFAIEPGSVCHFRGAADWGLGKGAWQQCVNAWQAKKRWVGIWEAGKEMHTQQKYLQRTSEIVNQQNGNENIKKWLKKFPL